MGLHARLNSSPAAAPSPVEPLRSAVRFPLRLPVMLIGPTEPVPATTVDVSSTGILFSAARALAVGTTLEWELRLPADSMGTTADITVLCRGSVVWTDASSPVRMAVQIEDYELKEQAA